MSLPGAAVTITMGQSENQGSGRPVSFRRRAVRLPPGCARPYDAAEWRDALVIVSRGQLELESCGGQRARFRAGSILWLADLPLRALHNPGPETAVLTAITRSGQGFPME